MVDQRALRGFIAPLALTLILACGGAAPTPAPTPTPTPDVLEAVAQELYARHGGDLDTYRNILVMNDCEWLRASRNLSMRGYMEADRGSDTESAALGYVNAARAKMLALDCDDA